MKQQKGTLKQYLGSSQNQKPGKNNVLFACAILVQFLSRMQNGVGIAAGKKDHVIKVCA